MSKQAFVVDCETNGLTGYTKLHCVVFREVESDEVTVFRNVAESEDSKETVRRFIAEGVSTLIGHNILGFDCGVLNHFLGLDLCVGGSIEMVDTLVCSRVLNFNQKGGHSLESWGNSFKVPKSSWSDFSCWSQALEERCITDTDINRRLYTKFKKYLESPRYIDALRLEHLTTALCHTICNNGFTFDLPKAISLRDSLTISVNNLLISLRKGFPKVSKPIREINPCLTKQGTLHSKDFRWSDGDLTPYSPDAPFTLFEWVEFNPNSPRQRVERLNAAGWKPFNKTKGHIAALRDKTASKEDLKHYAKYGWTCDEENLATLPDTAPEAARSLKEMILKTSRLGDLNEWISASEGLPVDPRGYPRIHPTLTNPGAWTMRVSHQNPNMANIPATLDRRGKVAYLGHECRSLWTVPEGYKLVGVDADSIQLRIFAHLCEDMRLIAAIEKGVKEEKTDIHHLNLSIMHPICNSREQAKTYIYALLLGAGLGKQAEILQCTKHEASTALKRMLDFYPGWKKLINGRLNREGSKGYIECLDGRYLLIPEPRQALAAHLQSGEKIIMSKAAQNWISSLEEFKDDYRLVNWVHDEWQTEVRDRDDYPEFVAGIQVAGLEEAGKQLKMNLKITGGKPKIGNNWAETH